MSSPVPAPTVGSSTANAAIALFLGAYILIALWQGNLGALATQARIDFLGGTSPPNASGGGGGTNTGFWRWAAALLILIWLANLPQVRPYAGGLIGFVLVAMLIKMATDQPQAFVNLQNAMKVFFGRNDAKTINQSQAGTA